MKNNSLSKTVSKYLEMKGLADSVKSGKASLNTIKKMCDVSDDLGKALNDALLFTGKWESAFDELHKEIDALKIALSTKSSLVESLESRIEADRRKVDNMNMEIKAIPFDVDNKIQDRLDEFQFHSDIETIRSEMGVIRSDVSEIQRQALSPEW